MSIQSKYTTLPQSIKKESECLFENINVPISEMNSQNYTFDILNDYYSNIKISARECKIDRIDAINKILLLEDKYSMPLFKGLLLKWKINDLSDDKIAEKAALHDIYSMLEFIDFSKLSGKSVDNIMILAAGYGDIEYVGHMLNFGATSYYDSMGAAAYGGHKEILDLLIKHNNNPKNINNALVYAARGGRKEIVELSIKYGADDYDRAICMASNKGYKEIVEMFVNNYVIEDIDGAMDCAASGGYKEIVQFLLNNGAKRYNTSMQYAAEKGYKDIVELMLKYGANIYDRSLISAAYGGYADIVKLMLDKLNTDKNRQYISINALQAASSKGHLNVVDVILENGYIGDRSNQILNQIMVYGATHGHLNIVESMLNRGANDPRYIQESINDAMNAKKHERSPNKIEQYENIIKTLESVLKTNSYTK